MQAFSVAQLASTAWVFGTWPSTSQKVTRNLYGAFFVVGTQSNDPINYTSTVFTLYWDRGDGHGPLAVWSGTLPTNLASLEAFESGEVHIVCCNITTGDLIDVCWQNIASSTTPTTTTTPGFGVSGKIGSITDDARRCIYMVGLSGNFAKIDPTGALISMQMIFAASGGDVPEYFSLSLDEPGNVYLVNCNAAVGASAPSYDSCTAFMCANPGDTSTPPPSWFAGSFDKGAQLTVPFNGGYSGPGVYLTLGEQQRHNNNLLLGSTFSKGRLHALISQTPGPIERPYLYDDLRDLTIEAISMDWGVQGAIHDASVHRPLRGQTLFPKCAAGGIAQRSNGLFAVLHDRSNLVALKSTDNGDSWQDYAQTSLAPYLGSGTGPGTWWTPRDLGIRRGYDQDGTIEGIFTVAQMTPSQWANAPAGANPASAVYSFSLSAQ
jgi:hypothetical protein